MCIHTHTHTHTHGNREKRPGATAIFNGVLAGLAGITGASGYVSTQVLFDV